MQSFKRNFDKLELLDAAAQLRRMAAKIPGTPVADRLIKVATDLESVAATPMRTVFTEADWKLN